MTWFILCTIISVEGSEDSDVCHLPCGFFPMTSERKEFVFVSMSNEKKKIAKHV
jgi:hypothetical protein